MNGCIDHPNWRPGCPECARFPPPRVSNIALTDLIRDAVASGFDVTITVSRNPSGKGSMRLPSEWAEKLLRQGK
jgi:hypothetical protein